MDNCFNFLVYIGQSFFDFLSGFNIGISSVTYLSVLIACFIVVIIIDNFIPRG